MRFDREVSHAGLLTSDDARRIVSEVLGSIDPEPRYLFFSGVEDVDEHGSASRWECEADLPHRRATAHLALQATVREQDRSFSGVVATVVVEPFPSATSPASASYGSERELRRVWLQHLADRRHLPADTPPSRLAMARAEPVGVRAVTAKTTRTGGNVWIVDARKGPMTYRFHELV